MHNDVIHPRGVLSTIKQQWHLTEIIPPRNIPGQQQIKQHIGSDCWKDKSIHVWDREWFCGRSKQGDNISKLNLSASWISTLGTRSWCVTGGFWTNWVECVQIWMQFVCVYRLERFINCWKIICKSWKWNELFRCFNLSRNSYYCWAERSFFKNSLII